MRRIITKTVRQDIYVSENGRETPVLQMDAKHLVNAFGKAAQEDNNEVSTILKAEILRRMTPDVL